MNIILAEDQPLILESLKTFLTASSDMNVIASACNGQEALELIIDLKPDIAVLDVRMPKLTGVEVLKALREQEYKTPIVLLTTFDDCTTIREALALGVEGFLLKDIKPEVFISSLYCVQGGLHVYHPSVHDVIKSSPAPIERQIIQDKYHLTDKDMLIISGIVQGLSNKEIAIQEYCSEGVVKNRVSSVLSKMGLQARTQIAIQALQEGLV